MAGSFITKIAKFRVEAELFVAITRVDATCVSEIDGLWVLVSLDLSNSCGPLGRLVDRLWVAIAADEVDETVLAVPNDNDVDSVFVDVVIGTAVVGSVVVVVFVDLVVVDVIVVGGAVVVVVVGAIVVVSDVFVIDDVVVGAVVERLADVDAAVVGLLSSLTRSTATGRKRSLKSDHVSAIIVF